MKIGYIPYSVNLSSPSDRRRFPHYARVRGLDFEIYRPEGRYDLIVCSVLCDLSAWSRLKNRSCPVILDIPDGYLNQKNSDFYDRIKGFVKFFRGEWSRPELSFIGTLRQAIRNMDAVVCCSLEQRALLQDYNNNVFNILDFHASEITEKKTSYEAHTPFRLVWEGVGNSLWGLNTVAATLQQLHKEVPFELHILTDLRFRRLNRPFTECGRAVVDKILPGLPTYLYQWNKTFFSTIASRCDLAVIPMDMKDAVGTMKPENRLLLFWNLGIPTLVSGTLAYSRVMRDSGLSACFSEADWLTSLRQHISDQSLREENVRLGRDYLARHCAESELISRWDSVFASLK